MQAVQSTNTPSFETVWAALQDVAERQKETDRMQKETDRIVKNNAQQIGKLGKRFGEIAEYMIAPNLREKFRELGYDFPQACSNKDVSDHENNIHFEIDVMLENGDKSLLVEIKTKPTTEDINDHIKRLEKMRKYADLHNDKRTFLAAIAGIVMTNNVKDYALKQGFFVIEPSGETFNIISPGNTPKEW